MVTAGGAAGEGPRAGGGGGPAREAHVHVLPGVSRAAPMPNPPPPPGALGRGAVPAGGCSRGRGREDGTGALGLCRRSCPTAEARPRPDVCHPAEAARGAGARSAVQHAGGEGPAGTCGTATTPTATGGG